MIVLLVCCHWEPPDQFSRFNDVPTIPNQWCFLLLKYSMLACSLLDVRQNWFQNLQDTHKYVGQEKEFTWFPVNVPFNQWFPVQNKAFLLLTLEYCWAKGGAAVQRAFSLKGRTRQKTRRWPFASFGNATEVANVNPGFCSTLGCFSIGVTF